MNLLIGVTGSVATIKIYDLVHSLLSSIPGINIKIIATEHSLHFFDSSDPRLDSVVIHTDKDEWDQWKKRGDPVLHIELRNWADALLIAPLDANTLAKVSNGLCDNLLTCVVRAFDMTKPVIIAPAMNTQMYEHPFTAKHLQILQSLGYHCAPVVNKTLMCGETGLGGMAHVDDIVKIVLQTTNGIVKNSPVNPNSRISKT